MVCVSLRISFFRAGFCGVVWAWKGPFPVAVSHHGTGKKNGFPGLCQPVAHACKPMPNPAIFRFKICGFPGVAATTRGFSAGRTYQEFPARLHELMFVQENRERAVTLLWGSAPLFYTLLSCHPPAFLLSTSRSSTLPSAWAVKPRGAPGGALHGGGRLHGVRVCQRSTMRSSTLPCS